MKVRISSAAGSGGLTVLELIRVVYHQGVDTLGLKVKHLRLVEEQELDPQDPDSWHTAPKRRYAEVAFETPRGEGAFDMADLRDPQEVPGRVGVRVTLIG